MQLVDDRETFGLRVVRRSLLSDVELEAFFLEDMKAVYSTYGHDASQGKGCKVQNWWCTDRDIPSLYLRQRRESKKVSDHAC